MFVPVVDSLNKPLMPTTCSRAARWIKFKKATGFWKRGIYCVRLNVEPSDRKFQEIAVGIDPGSKREGFTVKSESHTFANIQTHAIGWVKRAMETRKILRRTRRSRNTPYRKCRWNRAIGGLVPSTKSRWQLKLRICKWLLKLFPITHFNCEDIKAVSKEGQRKWNVSFSPIEVGKQWFYSELRKLGTLKETPGFSTYIDRNALGLNKTRKKLSSGFDAHCVDSWVLANQIVGGHTKPDNTKVLEIIPLQFHNRQLHVQNFSKGGVRKSFGGSMSEGFKRGSLVKHIKHGLCLIGGASKGFISLHNKNSNKRICQNAKKQDINFLSYNTWRVTIPPTDKSVGFLVTIA